MSRATGTTASRGQRCWEEPAVSRPAGTAASRGKRCREEPAVSRPAGTAPPPPQGLVQIHPREPRAAAEAMGLVSRNPSLTLKTEFLFKRAEGSSTLSHLILFQKEAGAFMQPESSLWACKGVQSFPRRVSPASPASQVAWR